MSAFGLKRTSIKRIDFLAHLALVYSSNFAESIPWCFLWCRTERIEHGTWSHLNVECRIIYEVIKRWAVYLDIGLGLRNEVLKVSDIILLSAWWIHGPLMGFVALWLMVIMEYCTFSLWLYVKNSCQNTCHHDIQSVGDDGWYEWWW